MTFITGAKFVKHFLPRHYLIKLSGLEISMFATVCYKWKVIDWSTGTYAKVAKSEADYVIKALKMYQMEYPKASKNRKRIKHIISQVEHAVQNNIDRQTIGGVMRDNHARDV